MRTRRSGRLDIYGFRTEFGGWLRSRLAGHGRLPSRTENAAVPPAHQIEAWPPGHFYSPIPALDDVRRDEQRLFATPSRRLPGVALREPEQLAFFEQLARHYHDQPWGDEEVPGLRYYFDNDFFRHGEAIVLFCLMRHARPRRVVEIGSGFSSAAILDTNERFFNNSIACTFVEPYPEVLLSRLRPSDGDTVTVLRQRVQDTELEVFSSLEAGDVLVVDSTHVAKIGSDVNDLFFRILPALPSGVYVRFHDILYPFEYPSRWVYEGRAWNEASVPRAFLPYNNRFRIVFYNSFFFQFHAAAMRRAMPVTLSSPGSSLWLEVT